MTIDTYPDTAKIIVFYDNDCLFCTKSIYIIDSLDRNNAVFFSTLRGEMGRVKGVDKYCAQVNGTIAVIDTKTDAIYIASDAIIRIIEELEISRLGIYLLKKIPKRIRDAVYYLISNNRYLISKNISCSLPPKKLKDRMI